MAAKYFAILTNLGAAKLANATALGTQLEITHMAVGDGGGGLPIPNPAQTALIGERRRAAINLLTIDPLNNSQIISEQVIPEDVGGWWIREVGLFDKDGALVALANCPETYKPQLQEGSGRTQTIRVILIVSSTQSVSLKIDPSVVLSTRKYVDDNVIEVRAYVEKLMELHVAAAHPHKQYAKVASAPEDLDDLQKVAEAINNNPNFHADMLALINEKLAKNKNGEDILDKDSFRQNIGLKSAALCDVGTGQNQIPDMGLFPASDSMFGLPNGKKIIWGQGQYNASDAGSGTVVNFSTVFPRAAYIVIPIDYGGGANSVSARIIDKNSFRVWGKSAGIYAMTTFNYMAIGE